MVEWRKKKAEQANKTMERRVFDASAMELRADNDGLLKLRGYASVTETPYEVGFYQETIKRGAFKRTLGEDPDVQLLINHGSGGSGMPIARTKSGTMRLQEDDRGLLVEADLDPEDPDVQLLARKMKRGDIDQMSFAFQATDQDWNDDFTERSIRSVSIHRGDVSVVNQGANGSTMVALRARDALTAVGLEGLIEALTEWRDFTLLSMEERAGKAISAKNTDTLTNILSLVQKADDNVDEAIPMLAELLQVPNPGTDGGLGKGNAPPDGVNDSSPKSSSSDGSSRSVHFFEKRIADQQRLERLRKEGR
jgi:HK97 family phage prohead protease